MTWTAVGTPISLRTDWQYTEPVTGSYFKLKHLSFPVNTSYLIAQAHFNSDNSVELANIQEFIPTDQAQIFYLKPPPVFSDRRIAIVRVPKQSSLASELRRIIRNDLLNDSGGEFTQRRSTWSVEIEVSDYVEPVATSATTTTPASGDQYFSNVVLLLHMDGANNSTTFTDVKGKTVTPFGNVQISTAQSKFSGASALFDGNGDYLSIPDSLDFAITGDFTLETWVYLTAYSGNYSSSYASAILGKSDDSGNGWDWRLIGTGSSFTALQFNSSGISVNSNYAFELNTFYHLATVRAGTTVTHYVNGNTIGNGTLATVSQISQSLLIGRIPNNNYAYYLSGYLDDLRITKGIARYIANFTPPTVPFANN